MDFTKSESSSAAILAGDSIARFITGGGLACACVKQDIAPQSAVYGFECTDIYTYTPTKAKRLVRLVGTRSHVQARTSALKLNAIRAAPCISATSCTQVLAYPCLSV